MKRVVGLYDKLIIYFAAWLHTLSAGLSQHNYYAYQLRTAAVAMLIIQIQSGIRLYA